MPVDKIKNQQFRDRGKTSWCYVYNTVLGRVFEVYYDVTNMGLCREILMEKANGNLVLIWNRELKIGEEWKPLVKEAIENLELKKQ